MNRRDFLGLTSIAPFAPRTFHRSAMVDAAQQAWRRDGAGRLARIGVLTPHFDPVPESEMVAMAP